MILTRRALNRATLARQLLLRRHDLSAERAVAHLAGLQAQAPLAPYVGLWSRLSGFSTGELVEGLTDRTLVRAAAMRGTLHLLTAADFDAFGHLFAPLMERVFEANFRRGLADADLASVKAAGQRMLTERPHTRAELSKRLAERWRMADRSALAQAITCLLPVVQIPPRGIWGASGQATWSLARDWLHTRQGPAGASELVRRYLGSFGPASIADIQAWSGLTGVAELVEPLRSELRAFEDGEGRELFDLPDAPRPDPEVPAPPRFLPEYDNLLLAYADRTRVNPENHPIPPWRGGGATEGTLLIDGTWTADWKISRPDRDSVLLTVSPARRLAPPEESAVMSEAAGLLSFAAPDRPADIRFIPPGAAP